MAGFIGKNFKMNKIGRFESRIGPSQEKIKSNYGADYEARYALT